VTAAPQTVAEPIAPATTAAKRLAQYVSLFKTVRSTCGFSWPTAGKLLDDIRAGRWRKEVESVRAAYRLDQAKGDKLKRKLPGVTFAGVFRKRNNGSLEKHSGLLCLDFDGLADRMPDARKLLEADPHVLAVFVSPSGRGLKVIVPVDASDGETHRGCFQAAESYFRKLDLVVDATGKDLVRLCFVSWDPDGWVRPDLETDTPCTPFSPAPASLFTPPPPPPLPLPPLYTYTTPPPPTPTQQPGDLALLARVRAEAQINLEKIKADSPVWADLYQRVLADRFDLGLHCRNQWLAAAVPFLFLAFSKRVGCELALLHLRIYGGLYQGDEVEHRGSFDSLWAGCEANYTVELSATEREVFDALLEPEKSAFRICRDLARGDPTLTFFLACDHLALRLAPPGHVSGWRLLRAFEALGILVVVAHGRRRTKGQKSFATRYRWALPSITAAAVTTPGGKG